MNDLIAVSFGCFVMGALNSLHPCPFAANTAAISTIVGWPGRKRSPVYVIFLFSIGYIISLTAVALIIFFGFKSIPFLSRTLQGTISLFLGPILILVGMINVGWFEVGAGFKSVVSLNRFIRNSPMYILFTGMFFALAFCPATASIYFGVMLPLSVEYDQGVLFPVLFALGAVAPFATTAVLLRFGINLFIDKSKTKRITIISGIVLILLGVWISLERLYF